MAAARPRKDILKHLTFRARTEIVYSFRMGGGTEGDNSARERPEGARARERGSAREMGRGAECEGDTRLHKTQGENHGARDRLATRLASGLASPSGLATGLATILASGHWHGLAATLASALATGLAPGLASGLASGLATILATADAHIH